MIPSFMIYTIVHDLDVKVEQQTRNFDTKVSNLKTTMESNMVKIHHLLLLNGFSSHEFTLTEFEKRQARGGYGHWSGGVFYCTRVGVLTQCVYKWCNIR